MKYLSQPITRRAFLEGAGIACASLVALNVGLVALESPAARIRYEYDANGRLSAVTYPDGSRVGYAYDETGKVATADHRKAQFYLA